MKCTVVIKLKNNSDNPYLCTISTKSSLIRFKQIHNNNNNKFNCDNQTEDKKFIFTADTWSFWYFLNELDISAFYRQCVVRFVNDLKGIAIVFIVPPHREVVDRDWLVSIK